MAPGPVEDFGLLELYLGFGRRYVGSAMSSSRNKAFWLVIVVAGAAVIWLAMRPGGRQPTGATRVARSVAITTNALQSTSQLARAIVGQTPNVDEAAMVEPAPPDEDAAEAFVQQVIENPRQPIKPSLIPKLSDDQVDRLVREYFKYATPLEKYGIIWALGFSQNDRAFDTLRYSVIEEYAGKELTGRDNAVQLTTVERIGVLARHSDRAWNFLMDLTEENNWSRFEPWSEDYLTKEYKSVEASKAQVASSQHGSLFAALGSSGRPEFELWANNLLENEPSDFQKDAATSIEHSVFCYRQIQNNGYEYLYDEILYNIRMGSSAFIIWSRTPEGRKWQAWQDAQFTALHGIDPNSQPVPRNGP